MAQSDNLRAVSWGFLHADFEFLDAAQFFAHAVIGSRLGSLSPKGIQLAHHFPNDILSAFQILLSLLKFHFSRIAAALKKGDSCSFFDQGSAPAGLELRIWRIRPCCRMA